MAILGAMQSAAVRLMGQRPSVFFGASQVFELEIADLVTEVARDVCKSHDWQALTGFASFSGDGVTTAFDFPADYDRMTLNSDLQDSTAWAWGYQAITDLNTFLWRSENGFQPFPGGWIIYGGQFHFEPAPASGATAQFPYIKKDFARDADTLAMKDEFTKDTDTFLLPERLLTLGLVWRWRENKKLDFTGDQEAFMKAISEYAAKDRGSRVYRRSNRMTFPGTYAAYPFALG